MLKDAAPFYGFRIKPPLTEEERLNLKALAGVRITKNGSSLWVGENAAWMVERFCASVKSKLIPFERPPIRAPYTAIPRIPEMRERVSGFADTYPAYMLPWQRDLVQNRGHKLGVHLWWPCGAGKTLGFIAWSLLEPGYIVIVTRAAARRTIAADIKRFTTATYCILEGTSAKEIPTGTRFIITGWDTLVHHVDMLAALKPTTVIFDEIHRGKQAKRKVRVPQRGEDGEPVFNLHGEIEYDYLARGNMASAAEQLSKASQRRIGATASAVKDRLRDLWAQLDLVDPGHWGNFAEWAKRYCGASENAYGGLQTTGRSTQPYLDELRLRLSFCISQVPYSVTHAALPPKRRQVTYIPEADLSKDAGAEARAALAEAAKNARTDGGHSLASAQLAAAACRKRPTIVDILIEEELGANTKIVVFTGLRKEAEKLHAAIRKRLDPTVESWFGTGSHTVQQRDIIREAFMASPGPCVLVGTSEAWGECVAPDTLILGENHEIDGYAKGDRVIGATGLVACRGKKGKTFDGQMIEVRATGTLPAMATPNHMVCVADGHKQRVGHSWHVELGAMRWIPLQDVRAWEPSPAKPQDAHGHFMCIPRVQGNVDAVRFDLDAFTLDDNARKGRATRGAPRWLNLDEDMAWLMGLYAAEGSSSPRSKDGKGWRAFFSLDVKETDTLAQRLQTILAKNNLPATINGTATNGINVIVRCGPFARLLQHLMGHTGHNKHIPDEILFNKDLNVLRAFVDGYAAGDGHTRDHKVQTATVSKVLALQLQLALARFGRLGKITPWTAKPSKIRGRVVQGGPYFIVTWCWVNLRHQRYRVAEDHIAVPVKTVTQKRYVGPVRDIGTTDGTFLVCNLVVHNSLNLQDTDVALVGMLPYTPGQIAQLEGRFSRYGQKRPVRIRYLVGEGTYDEHVAQMLLNKLPSVEKIVGDEELQGFGKALGGIEDEAKVVNAFLAKILASDVSVDGDDDND